MALNDHEVAGRRVGRAINKVNYPLNEEVCPPAHLYKPGTLEEKYLK